MDYWKDVPEIDEATERDRLGNTASFYREWSKARTALAFAAVESDNKPISKLISKVLKDLEQGFEKERKAQKGFDKMKGKKLSRDFML